jgi:two-component system, LuxR family, response regulator FixJ
MVQTVYVVEDHALLADLLTQVFQDAGFQVACFNSGASFQNIYQGLPGVLVLDMHLKQSTGLQLQAWLNKNAYNIPVIFISGHMDSSMIDKAFQNGACAVFTKPFNVMNLVQAVQAAFSVPEKGARCVGGGRDGLAPFSC